MRMCNLEPTDVSDEFLTRVDEKEAEEFFQSGVEVILWANERDFYILTSKKDLEEAKEKFANHSFSKFLLYIEK